MTDDNGYAPEVSDALVTDQKLYVDHKDQWGPGRRTVMLAFTGGKELADADIASSHEMKKKTVSARRCELWRLGYVEPCGMKKITRQRGQVWRATARGRAAIVTLQADVS